MKTRQNEEMQGQGNLAQEQWEGASQTGVLWEGFYGSIDPGQRLPRSLDRELELAIGREQEGKNPKMLQSAGVDTALRCCHKERETAAQVRPCIWISF